MNKNIFLEIYNVGNDNSRNLLDSVELLCDKEYYSQAYALAYTALEEISKSQFAADVFTGLRIENDFIKFYRNHDEKIDSVGWAHYDASYYPHKYK